MRTRICLETSGFINAVTKIHVLTEQNPAPKMRLICTQSSGTMHEFRNLHAGNQRFSQHNILHHVSLTRGPQGCLGDWRRCTGNPCETFWNLQSLTRLSGFQEVEALSPTHRPPLPFTHSSQRLSRRQGRSEAGRVYSMKNSHDPVGNGTLRPSVLQRTTSSNCTTACSLVNCVYALKLHSNLGNISDTHSLYTYV
jgi:hypothetical protein